MDKFGSTIQSCLFCPKICTQSISRMLILIPILVFWISNPNSIFWQIWAEKFKSVFPENWHTEYLQDVDSYSDISFLKFQTSILKMLIFILTLVFWNSKPKSIFWGKFKSAKSNCLFSLETHTRCISRM